MVLLLAAAVALADDGGPGFSATAYEALQASMTSSIYELMEVGEPAYHAITTTMIFTAPLRTADVLMFTADGYMAEGARSNWLVYDDPARWLEYFWPPLLFMILGVTGAIYVARSEKKPEGPQPNVLTINGRKA